MQVGLDTIKMSSLNLQFCFRKQLVGMSKAKVAAEIVSKLNPELRIVGYQKNFIYSQFDIDYLAGFKAAVLALDNGEALSYVNETESQRKQEIVSQEAEPKAEQVDHSFLQFELAHHIPHTPSVARSYPGVAACKSSPSTGPNSAGQISSRAAWRKSYAILKLIRLGIKQPVFRS